MKHQACNGWRAATLGCTLALAAACGAAAPFTPASDDVVVERLPYRLAAPARELRQMLARQPQNLALALQVAREALVRARVQGEPRELGSVQAALAPWWSLPNPPAAVRLMRASVHQSRHAFDTAVADLDVLLADRSLPPTLLAQAALDRAAVLQVQGRFADAQQGCAALAEGPLAALGPAVTVPARACVAELRSLRGDPVGEAELNRLAATPGSAGWLALVRAELAVRNGNDAAAERLFRQALVLQRDVYTQVAWADWLLDAGRPAEVLKLGPDEDMLLADALLLRRALALKRLGDPRADVAAKLLAERFEAGRQRGDPPHAREEAMHALELAQEPARALRLALLQWQSQKEPADALLLLRAAHAAGQPAAAEPVRRFMQQTGLTDVRLARAETESPR
jgi:hypothetical protein